MAFKTGRTTTDNRNSEQMMDYQESAIQALRQRVKDLEAERDSLRKAVYALEQLARGRFVRSTVNKMLNR